MNTDRGVFEKEFKNILKTSKLIKIIVLDDVIMFDL